MLTQIHNEFGSLTVSKQIIDQIIDRAFAPLEGKLWLANYRGAVSDVFIKIGGFDSIAEKKVEMRENKLFIRLYVVSRLGESITENCGLVMKRIAKDVTELLELPLDNIEVVVTGTISKNNNIVKRELTLDFQDMLSNHKIDYDESHHQN